MHPLKLSEILANPAPIVSPEQALSDVLALMQKRKTSAVVVAAFGKPEGIITEQDVIKALHHGQTATAHINAWQIMTSPVITVPPHCEISEAYLRMLAHRVRHLVVFAETTDTIQLVSEEDFLDHLNPEQPRVLKKVEQVMSHAPLRLAPTLPINQVLAALAGSRASCALAVESEQAVGILTERDLVHIAQLGPEALAHSMDKHMSSPVHAIDSQKTVLQAIHRMAAYKVRHLAVTDERGALTGLVSHHDLMKEVPGEYLATLQKTTRNQLALLDQQAVFARIVNALPGHLLIAFQPDGAITFCSARVFPCWQELPCEGDNLYQFTDHPLFQVLKKHDPDAFFPEGKNLAADVEFSCNHQTYTINTILIPLDGMPDGHTTYLFLGQDRTEILQAKRKAEEHLHEWANLFDRSNDAILLYDQKGDILRVNDKATEKFGYSKERLTGMTVGDLLKTQDINPCLQALAPLQATGYVTFECDFVHANGGTFPAEVSASLVAFSGAMAAQGIVHDLTERKQREALIQETEQRWIYALEGAGHGVWDVNPQTREAFYSKQWKTMLGYQEDEVGSTLDEWEKRVHPDDRQQAKEDNARYYAGETIRLRNEHRLQCKDGSYKWILTQGTIWEKNSTGQPTRIVGTHTDITHIKNLERELQESETRLRTLIDTIPDLIWLKDEEGVYLSCNRRFEAFFGTDETAIIGKTDFDFVDQETAHAFRANDAKAIAKGGPNTNEEWITYPNGQRELLETLKTPMFDADGQRIGVLGIGRNITERKHAEDKLRESEERYRTLFEGSQAVMLLIDPEDGRIINANPAAAHYYGYPRAELITMEISRINTLSTTEIRAEMAEARREQRNHFHFRHRLASGEIRDVEVHSGPIVLGKKQLLFSIVHDISARRKAEESLRLYEKIISTTQDLLAFVDRDYTYRAVNESYAKAFCQSKDAIVDHPITDLFGEETFRQVIQSNLDRAFAGEVVENEHWGNFPALGRRYVRTSKHPYPSQGKIEGVVVSMHDLTAIKQEQERAQHYLDMAGVMLLVLDPDAQISQINRRGCEILGYEEKELINKSWIDLCIPEEKRADVRKIFHDIKNASLLPPDYFENEVLTKNGERRLVAWQNVILNDREENFTGVISSGEDITERHAAEEKLRQAAKVFESTNEGVMITSPDNRIIAVNRAFTEITGYSEQEALAQPPSMLRSGRHDEIFYQAMWRSIKETGSWSGEIWNRRKSGETYPQWMNINTVQRTDNEVENYVAVFTDITILKESEQKLEHLALHDPLTNLPNRLLLTARLEHALLSGKRSKHRVAVCFLDLDNFKDINDTYGHPMGDRIIIQSSKRLKEHLREEDTLARFGGDEFVVLLENIACNEDAGRVVEKLLELFEMPFKANGQNLYLGVSIGISIFPDDSENKDELIKFADAAMYRAKEEGKNTYAFYKTEMTELMFEKVLIENNLRNALKHNQFELYYQPQMDLSTRTISGLEALVRWIHPELGLISPAKFIPAAENTKLIIPLGEFVLATACRTLAQWRASGLFRGRVSVNVSGVQMEYSNLAKSVSDILLETELPAHCLEIEITESVLMKNPERWVNLLNALKEIGVAIAIDDFGTGYSSLSYLRQFPVDKLKIDQTFVRDLPENDDACTIADSIIALSNSMKLTATAEGIETVEQATFLLQKGCEEGQGYFFSRPLPQSEIENYLQLNTIRPRPDSFPSQP